MYLVMYIAWYLLQYLLGTALATPMPQYLEVVSNAFTTITMTVDTPPYLVVSNPATTVSIMEGIVGTVGPATGPALSTLSVDPPQADPPSSITAPSVSVASTSSTASSAAVVSAVIAPPAVSITFPSKTISAAAAPATSITFSAVAVISPTSNNTAVFVASGPVTPLPAVSSSAPASIQTPLPSNPINSTVVFSSTGSPIAIQTVSPSNPLNSTVVFSSTGDPAVSQTASPPNPLSPTAIFSSTGNPVASQTALSSIPLNSTVIFSSTGLPSASPAPIASSPPVTSAPSTILPASSTIATNVVSNSVQSAFNVVLSTNLAAIPGGISNQAPVPSITVPLPLISSFPAAADPTANPDGSHKVIPWTVPGTNVTIIATMATPNEAPAISATSYEYTIGSMQYYISGVLNTTGNAPLNASQDPFYWDIGYGCWVEFNTNPFLGASGSQLLTYSVIYNALQGMKDALLTSGWWYLAFIEIRVGPQGQVVGYATVSPSLAPKGSAPITNIDEALQALEQPVGDSSSAAAPAGSQGASISLPGAPADGGTAHKRRSWRWALSV